MIWFLKNLFICFN